MIPNWKAAFSDTLTRFEADEYVRDGAERVAGALSNLEAGHFLSTQLDALGRSGDEAGAKVLISGAVPLGKGRCVVIDADWSLQHIEDRNDRWLIQQWFFLRDCVSDVQREHDFSALQAVLPLLQRWAEVNLTPRAPERVGELNWHDHATALRAVNLVWLASLLRASAVQPSEHLALLFKLIEIHTVVLAAEDFYSVGTNHGFDQAYALYFLASVFPLSELQRDAKVLARRRLIFELKLAFNEEGVHIENSPGYHASMLGRLLKAKLLLEAFDGPGLVEVDQTLEKALTFLTHALKPDGTLPLLGDTEAIVLRLDLGSLKHFSAFPQLQYAYTAGKEGTVPSALAGVFPKAGYAFLRDRWRSPAEPDGVHLTLKCGFLSSYHRHDDDNTVLLFAFGEDWLIGGGIYKYHEQEELRKYVRSAQAHNLLIVEGISPNRNAREAQCAITDVTTRGDLTIITAQTRMFPGFLYQRVLTYDRASAVITLVDAMEPSDGAAHDYVLRFNIPEDHKVDAMSAASVRVHSPRSGRSMFIEVQSASACGLDVICGQAEPPLGWTSPQRGALKAARAVSFKASATGRFEIASKLSFSEGIVPMSCSLCDPAIERRVRLGDNRSVSSATPILIDGALADARCPTCGSRARHRGLAALLARAAPFVRRDAKLLLIGASKPERSICGKYFANWRHVSLMGAHDDPDCEIGVDVTKFQSPVPYDYILAWGIFDYIPETELALRSLAAALAPGGALIFYIMPYRLSPDVETVQVVHRNALKYESYAPAGATTGIPHCKFNPQALLRWMTESGLDASIVQLQDDSSPMLLDVFVGRKGN